MATPPTNAARLAGLQAWAAQLEDAILSNAMLTGGTFSIDGISYDPSSARETLKWLYSIPGVAPITPFDAVSVVR